MKRLIILLLALVALGSGALACGCARTPPPLHAPGWEGITVHTLCLEVEQSYPEIGGKSPEPIAARIQRGLGQLGLQVVAEGAPCDATLTLVLTGRALGAQYTGGKYCYNGAEVTGKMTLSMADREPLTLPVEGRDPTPEIISVCIRDSTDASFTPAIQNALVDGFEQLWRGAWRAFR